MALLVALDHKASIKRSKNWDCLIDLSRPQPSLSTTLFFVILFFFVIPDAVNNTISNFFVQKKKKFYLGCVKSLVNAEIPKRLIKLKGY
jgi:hypothetical protein